MTFSYPKERIHRRHGPCGYANYDSYRPWLRDEFAFRCIYCLKRETWGQLNGEFDLDHFLPQLILPDARSDYANLVYSCRRCNSVKRNAVIPDAFRTLVATRVQLREDGVIEGLDDQASGIVLSLDLNSPRMIEWRLMWMRIVELAKECDGRLWRRLVGFPKDMPDLKVLRPPGGNTRPEGIAESWRAQSEAGDLPESY